jgi:hypothetical protein
MPIERIGSARGPKYLKWKYDTTGIDCRWNLIDYGLIDQAIIAADVTNQQHTALAANSDVLAIPSNINSTLTATAVTTATAYLEGIGMPAQWVTTSHTYREVLRIVAGCFLYLQRVTAILGRSIVLTGGVLGLQMQNIAADIRAAMQQAADEQGFDYSSVTATTTVRQVLKAMADAWGDKAIYMGITEL